MSRPKSGQLVELHQLKFRKSSHRPNGIHSPGLPPYILLVSHGHNRCLMWQGMPRKAGSRRQEGYGQTTKGWLDQGAVRLPRHSLLDRTCLSEVQLLTPHQVIVEPTLYCSKRSTPMPRHSVLFCCGKRFRASNKSLRGVGSGCRPNGMTLGPIVYTKIR